MNKDKNTIPVSREEFEQLKLMVTNLQLAINNLSIALNKNTQAIKDESTIKFLGANKPRWVGKSLIVESTDDSRN